MARDVSATNKNASLEDAVSCALFVDMAWPDGNVRLHNGVGTITFGGNSYTGVGDLGTVEAVEETIDLQSRDINLILSGINDDVITDVLEDAYWGKDVDIYLGFFNRNGELLADPDNIFSGFMDKVDLVSGAEEIVKLTCTSRAEILSRRNGARFTDEEQQANYTGDVFFEYLAQMQEKTVIWGGEKVRDSRVNVDITRGQSRDNTTQRTP